MKDMVKSPDTPVEPARLLPVGFLDRPTFDTPFFRHFNDEMDRFFNDFGFRTRPLPSRMFARHDVWVPDLEVLTEGDRLIVRADLPGIKPENVTVEVTDETLVVKGERKRVEEEKKEGYYRSERAYGAFERTLPLPEGAIIDGAKATFVNGVLEVKIPIPPHTAKPPRPVKVEVASK
jgi:HSP20 family protein